MSVDICDRVNKMVRQIWHCGWCHSVAHTHANSSKCHLLGEAALQRRLSLLGKIKPWQPMSAHFPMYTPDLEQSGQHNSIWAPPETRVSLWATLQHTDETDWHCSTNRPEVWAWQPAATISSCHYLPGLSHRFPHTETCMQRAQKHTGLI